MGQLFKDVCESCDLGMSTLVRLAGQAVLGDRDGLRRLLGERVKRITIKPFMDMHTMLEERLLQCCVHVGTASRRSTPVRALLRRAGLGAARRDEAGQSSAGVRDGGCKLHVVA